MDNSDFQILNSRFEKVIGVNWCVFVTAYRLLDVADNVRYRQYII